MFPQTWVAIIDQHQGGKHRLSRRNCLGGFGSKQAVSAFLQKSLLKMQFQLTFNSCIYLWHHQY